MANILDAILDGLLPYRPKRAPKPAPRTTPGSAGAGATATQTSRPVEKPSFQPGAQPIDIERHLEGLAARSDQKLNWRTSIVDLMKLLDIDSSLENRKELARELGYTGDTGDSAAMNIWLHKQVMRRVAENGGKVPANLTD